MHATNQKEPTEPFLKSILQAKDLSNVASIRHGKQNEKVVRSHYARKMQKHINKNFTVYVTSLVVNPSHPYLGATPDGKVFDPMSASPFGLLKIKCTYAWRNHTMEAACDDVNFPCSMQLIAVNNNDVIWIIFLELFRHVFKDHVPVRPDFQGVKLNKQQI